MPLLYKLFFRVAGLGGSHSFAVLLHPRVSVVGISGSVLERVLGSHAYYFVIQLVLLVTGNVIGVSFPRCGHLH
jgi:hypothetical protein